MNVDPNGLAACVHRHETFPSSKIPASPLSAAELVGADQIPTPVPNLDVHRRLNQIGQNVIDLR